MPPLVAVQVVVVFVAVVVVAIFKVTRGGDAVEKGAVVQHGQVEAATVPAHERWCEFFDALEEALHDFVFAAGFFAKRPHFQTAGVFKDNGNGDDFVQMMAHEGAAAFSKTLASHEAVGIGIALFGGEVVQQAVGGGIGDGFDVKDKGVVDGHGRFARMGLGGIIAIWLWETRQTGCDCL